MRIKHSMAAVLAALSCTCPPAFATTTAGLYVVPGVFFSDVAAGKPGADNAPDSKIDPAFRDALDMAAASAQVDQTAHARFPAITATIDSSNRQRTLALSVQVTRASRYDIAKTDGTTDIYQPITLSAYLSNPMTGEVLQSFAQTRYSVQTVSGDPNSPEIAEKVRAAYRTGFAALLDSVLTDAAKNFKPYIVEAKAADTWHGYVILDKGYEAGIGKGDVMDSDNAEIRVEYSGAHYAVAVPVLGEPQSGALFSRPTTMALSDVRKPRVITLVSEHNPDLSAAVSTQLFADELGTSASFATLPLNANYSQVQASIDRHTQIGHQVSGQRRLPDYFIRMVLPAAKQYTLPTNLAYKTQQVSQAWAFAELVSRDGRVLYANDVNDRIDDTVTNGSGFNLADRREVVLKNALTDLAARFTRDIQFRPITLKLTDVDGDSFKVEDPGVSLPPGASFRVYHDIGHVSGVAEDVYVPTWEASVTSRGDAGTLVAAPVLPVAGKPPRPARGDVVLMDGIANTAAGGQRTAYCPAEKSQMGVTALDHFDALAYAAAARSRLFMVDPGIATLAQGKIGGQSGFASDLTLQPAAHDRCLVGLYRIDPADPQCDSGACTSNYKIRLGYQLKTDAQVTGQMIMQHGFTSSGYPAATPAADSAALQEVDLAGDTRTNLDVVLKQLLSKNP